MIRNDNRQGSPETLRMALVADEIARSLRAASLHKKLWDRDRRVIGQAVELLTEMKRGKVAIRNQKVQESVGAALAYSHAMEAVQAMRLRPASFESYEKLFELLVSELKDLQHGLASFLHWSGSVCT